ncbi:hypothetical protein JY448_01085 [Stenotrophomonas maltophilia]|nr:hypothetical protein [Stenotrophomonas maltophilia]
MRNLCLSAIAGALLLTAGCASQPGPAPLDSEAAATSVILLGEVDLPKDATLDDFPRLLTSGGMSWEKFEGTVRLDGPFGPFDSNPTSGRSLAVVTDVLSQTTRLVVRAGDQPKLSTLVVCVRGQGLTATASDMRDGDVCE